MNFYHTVLRWTNNIYSSAKTCFNSISGLPKTLTNSNTDALLDKEVTVTIKLKDGYKTENGETELEYLINFSEIFLGFYRIEKPCIWLFSF